jgi:pyridoxamine 5'-phosphate oxidase family protein
MSVFTQAEIEYLQNNKLGRLATVGRDAVPHVMPTGYYFDAESGTIQLGGRQDLSTTKKFHDLSAHPEAAFVVDDMASMDPPMPRGIEIRGRAEVHGLGGERLGPLIWGVDFQAAWIEITPTRIVSWGIEGPQSFNARSV